MTHETVQSYISTDDFSALDRSLSILFQRLSSSKSPVVELLTALVSRAVRESHVCIDLKTLASQRLNETLLLPSLEEIRFELLNSSIVGTGGTKMPLILEKSDLLYLGRFYNFESRLARHILERIKVKYQAPGNEDPKVYIKKVLGKYNVQADTLKALEIILSHGLCIISGGPGTGKTWTVGLIIELLYSLGIEQHKIGLAAPTGKAANRLNEALRLSMPGVLLPQAETLHRLIGIRTDELPRYDHLNQLPYSALIVDEASMVDTAMMTRIFDALRPDARLILLGDKDQLASVEAGAVMTDLFDASTDIKGNTLASCMVNYTKTYRFKEGGIILPVCEAIRDGKADSALMILKKAGAFRTVSGKRDFETSLKNEAGKWFDNFKGSLDNPLNALLTMNQNKILCAHHEGDYGTQHLNSLFTLWLNNGISRNPGNHFHGEPVMVMRNDYDSALFNGDTGIVLYEPADGMLKAYFANANNQITARGLMGLPELTTCFAKSVHKSQGSEYDEVHFILPGKDMELLTRELIYTAITRARNKITIWGNEEIFLKGVSRCSKRVSGLKNRLINDEPIRK